MKEESGKVLYKAVRAIEAAETLLKAGIVDFAAGRAYYAMFFTAEALLLDKGLSYSKHSEVDLTGECSHFLACLADLSRRS